MIPGASNWVLLLLLVVALGAAIVLAMQLRVARRRLDEVIGALEVEDQSPDAADDALVRARAAIEAAAAERASARRERMQLSGALDVHGDGVIVIDAAGEVVLSNEEGRRYHSARYSEALAEDAVRQLLARALEGERGESELALFGPPPRVLQLVAGPVRDDHEIVGAAAVVRDVTEARRTDTIRRDFVAAVSHELKTPIGALSLLAETMNASDDPAVVVQLADRIGKEAERLSMLVDDLLDLSIIEAQEQPRRERALVHFLVEEAYDQVRATAETAGVPIEFDPIDAALDVECDRSQVVSAIRNLLDNAVKYSEAGAAVEISAGVVDDTLSIAVRDHGIGIPQRDLERIFERFYRVDRARSRATGGTGLGLAIVRHVASAHGGDVSVDSVEGEGSVFRLNLPRATSARLSQAS